jgi:hypothetical protein
MEYRDFDLLIERQAQGYRAQVLSSPAGQATADFVLPFSDIELENCLLRLGRPARTVRRIESTEMSTAKSFRAALFNAVFSGDVRACLRSSVDEAKRDNAGIRVRLRLATRHWPTCRGSSSTSRASTAFSRCRSRRRSSATWTCLRCCSRLR